MTDLRIVGGGDWSDDLPPAHRWACTSAKIAWGSDPAAIPKLQQAMREIADLVPLAIQVALASGTVEAAKELDSLLSSAQKIAMAYVFEVERLARFDPDGAA